MARPRSMAIIAGGIAAGLITAAAALWWVAEGATLRHGPWRSSLFPGVVDLDPYSRAVVALRGAVALHHAEAVYFVATEDESGAALSPRCDYRLDGRDLPARWWSIHLGDEKLALTPGGQGVDRGSVLRGVDGGYTIHIGPTSRDGNWLSPQVAGGAFSIHVHLYRPDAGALRAEGGPALPRLVREGCTS